MLNVTNKICIKFENKVCSQDVNYKVNKKFSSEIIWKQFFKDFLQASFQNNFYINATRINAVTKHTTKFTLIKPLTNLIQPERRKSCIT